jgi:hypothetical protein
LIFVKDAGVPSWLGRRMANDSPGPSKPAHGHQAHQAWRGRPPLEGIFRVHKNVFSDPDIFELEMKHVFERGPDPESARRPSAGR